MRVTDKYDESISLQRTIGFFLSSFDCRSQEG